MTVFHTHFMSFMDHSPKSLIVFLKTMLIYEGLFYAMSSVAAAFILSLAVGPLAGKMLGSMFWFFEYRFTILPVLLTIPVFLLLGWLIPCMMYDNAAKCSVVEQLRDAQ